MPELAAEELANHVAVRAESGSTVAEPAQQAQGVVGLRIVAELVPILQGQRARSGQRLDRLDAAEIRAREHAGERTIGEQLDQSTRLPAPLVIERSRTVVADPPVAIARARVANEIGIRQRPAQRGRGPT